MKKKVLKRNISYSLEMGLRGVKSFASYHKTEGFVIPKKIYTISNRV